MVIPGWRYLVSGGTTGQVFSKLSSADGDYSWVTPSSGGTPGGSTTQIQFNNAGAFGGDANFIWTSATGRLDITAINGGLGVRNPDTTLLLNATTDGSTKTVTMNCSNAFSCNVSISSTGGILFDSGGGLCRLGDPEANWYGTAIIIDDPNSTITIGDLYGVVTGTLLAVDAANSRATFNKKFVVTDAGDYYAYDTGTSTYWKWESISGVWTGTDTTSGSLP